jgi:hypothetical protein
VNRPVTTTPPRNPAPAAPDAAPDLGDLPLAMTHAGMNAAFDEGTAALLSAAVPWLVRHREAWWVAYERGWLRITDAATAQDLDQAAARLAKAEAAADDLLNVIRHEHMTTLTVNNSCQQASPSRLSVMPTLTPGCSPRRLNPART